ncbi:response regulator transcription factor [Candidatus Woesearchaeota archaeon]|nr:response regulator transcription factor [Candidatus Woesearchaeota archaeon]
MTTKLYGDNEATTRAAQILRGQGVDVIVCKRERVLILEPYEPLRRVEKKFLEGAGYQVYSAATPADALQIIGYGLMAEYLALILDLDDKRDVDGIVEIVGCARSRAFMGDVIITFAGADYSHQLKDRISGAEFLQKPFRLKELEALIAGSNYAGKNIGPKSSGQIIPL